VSLFGELAPDRRRAGLAGSLQSFHSRQREGRFEMASSSHGLSFRKREFVR
jgi:hypothetical protein